MPDCPTFRNLIMFVFLVRVNPEDLFNSGDLKFAWPEFSTSTFTLGRKQIVVRRDIRNVIREKAIEAK